jgi:CBS domain-containing protein
MKIVFDILQIKGRQVWSVSPDTTVYDALSLMADEGIGAVLVLHDDQPVGIFSERDYARKVILKGKSSRLTPVKEIMSTQIFYVSPEQTIAECMALMTEKHIRHLPVLKDGALEGIISIGDVVKALITDHEFTIDQLERYISGSGYAK